MRKCSLDKINSIFEEIAKNAKLYLPVDDKDGSAVYKQWENGVCLSDALNTVRSPKDFFFPQIENLMEFKTDGKNIEVIDTRTETEDFVFISCGTWSLFGTELDTPNTSDEAKNANFTNEGGIQYRFRFLKNYMGMWLMQNIRRKLHFHPLLVFFFKLGLRVLIAILLC